MQATCRAAHEPISAIVAQASTTSEEERLGIDFGTLWQERQKADTLALVERESVAKEGTAPIKFDSEFSTGCALRHITLGARTLRILVASRYAGQPFVLNFHVEMRNQSACSKRKRAGVAPPRHDATGECHVPSTLMSRLLRRRLTQYKVLVARYFKAYWRSPPYNTTRIILSIVAALIIGSFYWSRGDNYGSTADVLSVLGALFMTVMFVGFINFQVCTMFVAFPLSAGAVGASGLDHAASPCHCGAFVTGMPAQLWSVIRSNAALYINDQAVSDAG